MTTIGTFQRDNDGILRGEIRTLQVNIKAEMIPVGEKPATTHRTIGSTPPTTPRSVQPGAGAARNATTTTRSRSTIRASKRHSTRP